MLAHAVTVPVDVEHDTAVQEPVQHGSGHHRVVEDFPQEPRFVVKQMLPFRYLWVMTWKRAAAWFPRQVAGSRLHRIMSRRGPAKSALSLPSALRVPPDGIVRRGRPPSCSRCDSPPRSRPGPKRRPASSFRHRAADEKKWWRRPEPERGELLDHCLVDRWLGVEVEVLDTPGGSAAAEALEAGLAPGVGGSHLNLQQPGEEGRVPSLFFMACLSSPGSASAAAERRREERRAQLLVERVLAHG